MKRPKLIDAFPTLLTTGAFMTSLSIFTREDISLSAVNAGIAYALQHSGQKKVSSYVEHYLDDDGTVTSAGITSIGALLEQYYGTNWNKLLDAFIAEYNPIENYNSHEEWSDTKSGSDTLTDDIATKQDTHLYGSKSTTNAKGQDKLTDVHGAQKTTDVLEKYAEDGGYANDSRNTRDDNSFTDTHTRDAVTDTITEGTHTDTFTEGSHKDTHETEYDSAVTHIGDKVGNIGTMSTQDMIQQEWAVRSKDFFNKMFNDIDEFLCVGCY